MKISIIWLVLVIALTSCTIQDSGYLYRQQSGFGLLADAEYQSRRSWVLSEKAAIAVATLQASYLTERQNKQLLEGLVSRLSEDFVRVEMIAREQGLHEQLAIARALGVHYLVIPNFVDSRQGLNAISELTDNPVIADIGRDTISFKMVLYDVPNASLVDVSMVRASSAILTLEPTEPLQVATSAFDLYVGRLSAAPHH